MRTWVQSDTGPKSWSTESTSTPALAERMGRAAEVVYGGLAKWHDLRRTQHLAFYTGPTVFAPALPTKFQWVPVSLSHSLS